MEDLVRERLAMQIYHHLLVNHQQLSLCGTPISSSFAASFFENSALAKKYTVLIRLADESTKILASVSKVVESVQLRYTQETR